MDLKWIIVCFIAATCIGTYTHELGHYAVAKWYGCAAKLHYGSTSYYCPEQETLREFGKLYGSVSAIPEERKAEATLLFDQNKKQQRWITWGGVLVTLAIGTLGFLMLCYRTFKKAKFSLGDWLLVLATFFWSRELFNLGLIGIKMITNNTANLNATDEIKLALSYGIPAYSLMLTLAILAAIILMVTTFRIVPRVDQRIFILGGLIGSTLGYCLWFFLLGPLLLP